MVENKGLEDGIYVIEPCKWLVVEGGVQQTFSTPDYDLPYLLRAYEGRLPFSGPLNGVKRVTAPSVCEL